MTTEHLDNKIDKFSDKIDSVASDITEIRILNARIYENLNHHKETLDRHSKKHEAMEKHVVEMENNFNDRIHQNIKSARMMGYIGTMIGSVTTFIVVKLPQLLPKLFN